MKHEKQILEEYIVDGLIDEQVKKFEELTQKLITPETAAKKNEIGTLVLNRQIFFMMISIIGDLFEEMRESFEKYQIIEEFVSGEPDSKYYQKSYEKKPTAFVIRNNLYHALSIITEKLSNILNIANSIELSNISPELYNNTAIYFAEYSIIDELFKKNYYEFLDFLDCFAEDLHSCYDERKEDN